MPTMQVKEVVVAPCGVCGLTKKISFFSYSICENCFECPECGGKSFKTKPYICVETAERYAAVQCTSCGKRYDERIVMDRILMHRAHSQPASICKLCGKDVDTYKQHKWNRSKHEVHVCDTCMDCPRCHSGGNFMDKEGKIVCRVCKAEWGSSLQVEAELVSL